MPAEREGVFLADSYVRHQGPTTGQHVFPSGGPNAGWCVVCDRQIAAEGEPVTLVAIGCAEPDDQAKMREGRWVSARALIVHATCAGLGEETPEESLHRELHDGTRNAMPPEAGTDG